MATKPEGTGHVVIVTDISKTGNDYTITIMESGGTSFNVNSLNEMIENKPYQGNGGGTYRKTDLKERLWEHVKAKNPSTIQKSKILNEIAWIRFLQDDKTFLSKDGIIKSFLDESSPISSPTITRLEHPKLYIEKTASVPTNSYVSIGDNITYTIEIRNDSTEDYDSQLILKEVYNSNLVDYNGNLTVIDSDGNILKDDLITPNDNYFTFTIGPLEAGKGIEISYNVTVKNDASLYGKTIHSTGTVGDINNAEILHYIGKCLTNTEKQKILNNLNVDGEDMEYIANVYQNALGIDLSNYINFSLNDVIETKKDGSNVDNGVIVWKRSITDPYLKGIVVSNFYGEKVLAGTVNTAPNRNWSVNTSSTEKEFSGRAKYILEQNLQVGDIIIWNEYDKEETIMRAYIYIGDSTLVGSSDISISKTCNDSKYIGLNYSNMQVFLDNLVFSDYMIIRPALFNNYSVEKDEKITFYPTLESAYNGIEDSTATIKLEKDLYQDKSRLIVENGKNITIDTNGKTLIKMQYGVENNGTLIISGDGVFRTNGTPANNVIRNLIVNTGTLNIYNVSVENRGTETGGYNTIYSTSGDVNVNNGAIIKAIAATGANTESYTRAIVMLGNTEVRITGGSVRNTISEKGQSIASWSSNNYTTNGHLIIEQSGEVMSSSSNAIAFFAVDGQANNANLLINGGIVRTNSQSSAITLSKTDNGVADGTVEVKGDSLIESKEGIGISIQGDDSSITIGEKDGKNSNTPIIIGKTCAIDSKSGFSFYDGMLKGVNEASVGTIIDTESDFDIDIGTENINSVEYKTMTLKEKPQYIKGDVNHDEVVDIIDVRMLLQKVINESYDPEELYVLDIDEDEEVTIIDVRMLLQHIINN